MINKNYIVVFDFETSGLSWIDNEPVQLASITLDPYTLEIVPGSEFSSLMKPVKIFTGTEQEIRENWARCYRAWSVNKKTKKELEDAPLPEHVWSSFVQHIQKYNTGGVTGKPIAAGQNIQGFDLYFINELCKKYGPQTKDGLQNLFNHRIVLDTLNVLFLWTENSEEPVGLGMDIVREWLGINKAGAHDALIDVKHTAAILRRFMVFHRTCSTKATFKNAFKNIQIT